MAQDIRALCRRWFEEVWNRGREEVIEQMTASDARIHGLGEGGRQLSGPREFHLFYRRFRDAFTNMHIAVDDVIVEGDKSAVRITFTGAHSGDGLGIPAMGRNVRATGIVLLRWIDGRVCDAWNEFDAAGLMAQLTGPNPVQMRA